MKKYIKLLILVITPYIVFVANINAETQTGSPEWAQQAYIKASNTGGGDNFGESVALSSDGNTLAVSTIAEDSNATGINGNESNDDSSASGAVYVFTRSSTTSGIWIQEAYIKASNTGNNDRFGQSIALSSDGNTLAVGAYFEDSNATGINGNESNASATNSGAVYVFTRSSTTWTQEVYIKASNTGRFDQFGYSIALSSDGNTLAVGASGEDSNATGTYSGESDNSASDSGAVYVFTRSSGIWMQEAYIKASNTGGGDAFGRSVALSNDGNTLAVSAYFEDSNATGINGDESNDDSSGSGAVYVFTRSSSGTWIQEAYIKASNTGSDDNFGFSIALSSDGNTLAVGANTEDSNATGINGEDSNNSAGASGAVYVFIRSGTWMQQAYIKASNTGSFDQFGYSIALSSDGNTLAVGANGESSNATGINGDDSNNNLFSSGAVYVFTRSTTWMQQAYIKASNTDTFDVFGQSVALSADSNTLAVGAYFEDSNATGINGDESNSSSSSSSGAVYVFYFYPTYTLNIIRTSKGNISSVNINCGAVNTDCSQNDISFNSSITLTAVATTNYVFYSWVGDCQGISNPLTIIIDSNKTCSANFVLDANNDDIADTINTSADTSVSFVVSLDGGLFASNITPLASSFTLSGITNGGTITVTGVSNNLATLTFTPQLVGTDILIIVYDEIMLASRIVITSIGMVSQATSSVLPSNTINTNASVTVSFLVVLKDSFGNNITAIASSFTLSGITNGGTFTVTSVNSNIATLTFTPQSVGTDTLTITYDDVVLATRAVVTRVKPSFTLATNTISFNKNASNTIYYQLAITGITDLDNVNNTFTINTSGNTIFTTNPAPVVSFATNTIATTMILSSTPATANLYFTIIPDATGTGVIDISLQDTFGNTTTQSVTVTVTDVDKAPIISQDITTYVNDAIANAVSNGYVYANDIAVFGGSLYFSITASPANAGANFSDFIALQPAFSNTGQTVNNRLGAHLAIIDSQEERNLLATLSDGTFDSFLGMAAADITGFGVSGENATWTTVLGDFITFDPLPSSANNEIIAPGRYDFIGAGSFADGPAGSCFHYQNSGDFNDRPCGDRGGTVDDGFFELPSGLPALDIANSMATLTQDSDQAGKIATLSGFDLDGDNIVWSGTSTSGGTITFSVTNTLASTSTVSVFYQASSSFAGTTTVIVSLTANNKTTNATININVVPGASANDSSFTLSSNNASVGSSINTTITILDFSNNLIAGNVTFTISNNGTASLSTTSQTGVYLLSISNTISGTTTITIAVDGATIGTQSVTFNSGIATVNSRVSGVINTNLIANNSFSFNVQLRDTFDNNTSGSIVVDFNNTPSNIIYGSFTITNVNINTGSASITYNASKAGTDTMVISVNGTVIASRTITTFAGKVDKDNSTITGNATTNISADNSITFTAILKDSFGNNVTAIASSFTFTGVTNSGTITVTNTNTNSNIATLTFTPQLVGTDNLTIAYDDVVLATRTIITSNGRVNKDSSTITGNITTNIIADNSIIFTAILKDRFGNNITAIASSFTFTGVTNSGTVTVTNTNTNSNIATLTFTPQLVGTDNLTIAYDDVVLATRTIITSNGRVNKDSSTITGNTTTNIIADNSIIFTAILKDRFGNNVNVIASSFTLAGVTNGGTITVTDTNNNIATLTFTPQLVGTDTLTITYDDVVLATRTIITHSIQVDINNSTITGNASTNINTSNSITFTATLKDSFGNNITAIASSFTLSGITNGGTFTVTDVNSNIAILTFIPQLVGTDTLIIAYDNVLLATRTVITHSIQADINNSTITGNATTNINISNSITFTATLKDSFGNNIPAIASSFTLSGITNGGTFTVTDVNGNIAILTFIPQLVGTDTLIIAYDDVVLATRTIITSFGRTSKDNSTITGNATTNINISNSITFTATLKDSFGNNIPAIASSFTLSGITNGGTFTVTDVNGNIAILTFIPQLVGTDTLIIAYGGIGLATRTIITHSIQADINNSTITGNASTNIIAGNSITFTATLKDSFGNNITAIASSFTLSGITNGGTFTVTSVNSNIATLTFTPQSVGTDTLTITYDDVVLATRTVVTYARPSFTLATNTISFNKNASNTIYYQLAITGITDLDNVNNTFTINTSGNTIFTTNPAPVVSFATNTIATTMILSSTPITANLYFTIIPDTIGTGVINISLQDAFNTTTTKSVTVTVIETNSGPVITNAFDNRLFNVSVFGGSIYADSALGTNNNGSAASTFQGVINDLGGHFLILNSSQERTFIDGSIGFVNSWYGIVTDKAISSNDSTAYPFNLLQVTDSATQIYAQVTADTVYSLYPGFYDREWSSTQPSNQFANGTIARLMSQFVLRQNNSDFGGRKANYEFPNGFTPTTTITANTIIQGSSQAGKIATLSGFDLDGDNVSWSGTSANGGTVTFSQASPNSATSTTDVMFQPSNDFAGDTSVVVSLTAGTEITSATINITIIPVASASDSSFTLSSNTATVGNNIAVTITIMGRNNDNSLTSAAGNVTFTINNNGTGSLTTTSQTGTYLLSVSNNTTGVANLDIAVDGAFIGTQNITFNPDTVLASTSIISGNVTNTLIAGLSISFDVQLRDRFANNTSGSSITAVFSNIPSYGSFTITNIDINTGSASITYNATKTGTDAIIISVNGAVITTRTIIVQASVLDNILLTVMPTAIIEASTVSITLVATLRDSFNNIRITDTSTTTFKTSSATILAFNTNGLAFTTINAINGIATLTFTVSNTSIGVATITAYVAGIGATITITVEPNFNLDIDEDGYLTTIDSKLILLFITSKNSSNTFLNTSVKIGGIEGLNNNRINSIYEYLAKFRNSLDIDGNGSLTIIDSNLILLFITSNNNIQIFLNTTQGLGLSESEITDIYNTLGSYK